jgi:DNA-directed RNA polymerase specialized sigma24 family protein
MSPADVLALRPRFERMAGAFLRGRYCASVDAADLVQIDMVQAMECMGRYADDGRATFATFIDRRVRGAWSDALAGSHYGPSTSTRHNMRKRGQAIDYGEVSFDAMPPGWLDNVADTQDEPMSYLHITPAEAAIVIADIDRELAREAPKYINRNSTRTHYTKGAFYVFAKVMGREQFVCTAKTEAEAIAAQKAFLRSLREWCVAAIEGEQ